MDPETKKLGFSVERIGAHTRVVDADGRKIVIMPPINGDRIWALWQALQAAEARTAELQAQLDAQGGGKQRKAAAR